MIDCTERWSCESYDEFAGKCEKRLGYEPDWLRMAWEENKCRYIAYLAVQRDFPTEISPD